MLRIWVPDHPGNWGKGITGAGTIEKPHHAGSKPGQKRRAALLGGLPGALLLALAPQPAMAAPSFDHDGALTSNTGQVQLDWNDGGSGEVTLEMARSADFADPDPLYSGTRTSYVLTGLAGGEYHLRLRDASGALSQPITLTVEHQSLTQALWLTAIGALITLGIVATIVVGARAERRGDG